MSVHLFLETVVEKDEFEVCVKMWMQDSLKGLFMAQAVSHRPFTEEHRFHARTCPCRICGEMGKAILRVLRVFVPIVF
jgi:hypothetical protein